MDRTTLSTLAESPDRRFEITDDEEAKQFLFELGIISRFNRNPANAKPTVQSVIYNEHPTHHIVAFLYLGNDRESDNGYLVHCLPKTQMSRTTFLTFANEVLESTGGRIVGSKPFWSDSPDN